MTLPMTAGTSARRAEGRWLLGTALPRSWPPLRSFFANGKRVLGNAWPLAACSRQGLANEPAAMDLSIVLQCRLPQKSAPTVITSNATSGLVCGTGRRLELRPPPTGQDFGVGGHPDRGIVLEPDQCSERFAAMGRTPWHIDRHKNKHGETPAAAMGPGCGRTRARVCRPRQPSTRSRTSIEPAVTSEPQLGTPPLAIPQGKGSNKGPARDNLPRDNLPCGKGRDNGEGHGDRRAASCCGPADVRKVGPLSTTTSEASRAALS